MSSVSRRSKEWRSSRNRSLRLVVGLGLLLALFWTASRSTEWPGAVGRAARASVRTDHHTTALFYTEIEGWRRFERGIARTRASRSERLDDTR